MLKITNLPAFQAQVKTFVGQARATAQARLTQLVREAQIHAADISPVYSGDYASNWNVSFGTPDESFKSNIDYTASDRSYTVKDGYSVYPEPRDSRWGMGNFKMTGFALGQTVFLTNAANHDEPYAWKIENKEIKFRDVNVGKESVGRKTADWIGRRLGV